MRLLDSAAARAYWDDRHREASELRSGGHIGLTEAGNEAFYAIRLGLLLPAIADVDCLAAPLQVLDAGCGKGYFSRALARCGYLVDSIDASPAAVETCRLAGGGPRYTVGTLSGWRSTTLYDAILAVDVLFHVLDDGEWRASLDNLAAHVRFGGRLIVADSWRADRHQLGNYIVHRPVTDYEAALEPQRFRRVAFLPYHFRDSQVGFQVWVRGA